MTFRNRHRALSISIFLIIQTLLMWCLGSAAAVAAQTIELHSDINEVIPDRRHLKQFIDSADAHTIDDFLAEPNLLQQIDHDLIDGGQTSGSVWAHVRVSTESHSNPEDTWLLSVDYTMLSRVDIYLVAAGKVLATYQVGYEQPMHERMMPYRFFLQPLTLKDGREYDIYLNAARKRGQVKVPLKLTRPMHFTLTEISHNYLFGIIFGVMMAMFIYNIFIYFSVREKVYFYYLAYIASVSTALLATSGYGYLFIWSAYPWLNEYIISMTALCGAMTIVLFCRHFLRQEYDNPLFVSMTNWAVRIGLGLIVWKLVSGRYIFLELIVYLCTLSVVGLSVILYSWKQGSRAAGFFLLSTTMLMAGTIVYLLSLLNILPSNALTTNAALIGAAAELLMLSWGLADRINRARRAELTALEKEHNAVLQLKHAEKRLMHRALHSGSTGLPNRSYFKSRLQELMEQENQPQFGIMLINLNNFHEFNKTLGHSNGSAILEQMTQRMQSLSAGLKNSLVIEASQSEPAYLASIEGVTFALLIEELNYEKLFRIGLTLLSEIEKPFEYKNLNLMVEASAGIALFPCHGESSEILLRNAHIALEAADNSTDKLAIYSQKIDPYNERRISLVSALKKAMDQDELQLHFQPQISLKDSRVYAVEVLLRWSHPEYGFIPPDEFIPLAERTGTINALTLWILNKAFEFKALLNRKNHKLNFAINISARNLQDREFTSQVKLLATKHGIDLSEIVMELTETAIMNDPEAAAAVMKELSELGLSLSIDDFGTGHASLSYIRRLPVNEIKIDRSFVMEMTNNHDDQVIVNTTLQMGHNLNLRVVAEGIEDYATLLKLRDMGCDLAQGYYIARPMPSEPLLGWLRDYQSKVRSMRVVNNDSAG